MIVDVGSELDNASPTQTQSIRLGLNKKSSRNPRTKGVSGTHELAQWAAEKTDGGAINELAKWAAGMTDGDGSAGVSPEPSPTEMYKTKQEADLTRSVATDLAKANAYGAMTDTGTGDLPKEFSPEAVKQLSQPKASQTVIPMGGKFVTPTVKGASGFGALKQAGQSVLGVLDVLDRFLPFMRPLRGAILESANEFSSAMKDPNYDVRKAPLAPFKGVWNALSGKDPYMLSDTIGKATPALGKVNIFPLLGAGMTTDTSLAEAMNPKLSEMKQKEREAQQQIIQDAIAGTAGGPTFADVAGFAGDVALGSIGAKLPSPLRIGRGEFVPTAQEVITPEATAAAKAANAARQIRKFQPVNTAERTLDEVMQAAKSAPLDTEATITNSRQARAYLQKAFNASSEEVAAMSDAEATNLALEAQQAKAVPTAVERVAREASARGTTSEALFSAAQESPVDKMRRLGEKNRLGRAAGIVEPPSGISNPFVQPEATTINVPKRVTRGLEVFGKEVITPEQAKSALGKVADITGFKKLGETAPVTKFTSTVNKMFNRQAIPKDAPKEIAQIPSILDRQSDVTHATETGIIGRLRPAYESVKPSTAESELTFHMRDLGLPFTPEGVAEAVDKARLSPELANLKPGRIAQLKTLDEAFQSEYAALAKLQHEAGMTLHERPNYVTHIIELNKDAGNEFEKAFPNALARFKSSMSGTHGFMKERSIPTIADAKAINRAAEARGIPKPLNIVTENYLDAFSRYTQSALRAVTNRNVFKEIRRQFPELIVESKISPDKGWVQATQIPGLSETLDSTSHLWIHPAAAEKLSDELIRMRTAGGSASLLGTTLGAFDAFSNFTRGMLTVARAPKFQARNLVDNTAKRFVFDAMGSNEEALAIMKGGEGIVSLQKPIQVRDFTFTDGAWKHTPGSVAQVQSLPAKQWKDLAAISGLTETGQFGRYGDIATELQREVSKGKFGKLTDIPREFGRATEDASKIALALDVAQKTGDLQTGVNEANRILFRYSDITPFERDVLRPLSGFYTFPRKNIPLMSKALLSNPEKFAQLGLAANEVRTKDVDEGALPAYQRQELTIPIRGPNGKITTISPGFSVGDAFKVFPSRWAGQVGDTANPLVVNTVANFMGQDRFGNKLNEMAPRPLPGNPIPDSWWAYIGKELPFLGIMSATVDGKPVVRIPAQTRAWLDEVMIGAPGEIAAILEEDKPDETKAAKIAKWLLGTFYKTTTDQELRIRRLRAADENVSQRLKAFREVTQQPIGIRKFQPQPQTIGK